MNAARAIISEKSGHAVKTHSGTRTKMHELVQQGLDFDKKLLDFLAKAFDKRQRLEYGPPTFVQRAEAEQYLHQASAFLAAARKVCE